MNYKCLHCQQVSSDEEWNKETERQCNEGTAPIQHGYNNLNYYYICPFCGEHCFKGKIVKVEGGN